MTCGWKEGEKSPEQACHSFLRWEAEHNPVVLLSLCLCIITWMSRGSGFSSAPPSSSDVKLCLLHHWPIPHIHRNGMAFYSSVSVAWELNFRCVSHRIIDGKTAFILFLGLFLYFLFRFTLSNIKIRARLIVWLTSKYRHDFQHKPHWRYVWQIIPQ